MLNSKLVKELDVIKSKLIEKMVHGREIESYADYKQCVGRIRGFSDAINLCKQDNIEEEE
jgi:hypothetical protein